MLTILTNNFVTNLGIWFKFVGKICAGLVLGWVTICVWENHLGM